MSRRKIKAGSTSNSIPIFVRDTSSSTGAGLSGLVFNTAGLVAEYRRAGASTWTAITLVTKTLGTYASGGFIVDGSALPGCYELDVPNAAFAAGATWGVIRVYGAANMAPVLIEFELDAVDYQDATAFGLSRLDAAITSRQATLTFPTNFSSLSIDGSGRVDVGKVNGTAQTARDLGGQLDAAISSRMATFTYTAPDNANIGVAATQAGAAATSAASVDTKLSPSRAGYLDNLNVGGAVASQAAVLNITNGTFISTDIPVIIERPDSGTESLVITLAISDETGAAVNFDASALPTVVLTDTAGVSQAGRLSAWTNPATGKYQATYTSSVGDAITRLRWEITGTTNGKVRRYVQSCEIVDTTAVSFTSSDRTNLGAIKAKTDLLPASPAATTDIPTANITAIKAKTDLIPASPASTNDVTTSTTTLSGLISGLSIPSAATIAAAVWAAGSRTLSSISDSAGVTAIKVVTDKLATMIEQIGVTSFWRFVSGALSQAPTGSGGGSGGLTPEQEEILQRTAAAVGAYNGHESQSGTTITQVLDRPDGGTLTKVSSVSGNQRNLDTTTTPGP